MKFEEKYKKEASKLSQLTASKQERIIAWRSPSNIALIKYWGKRDHQLPQNPSLSFTLDKSYTETRMQYESVRKKSQGIDVDFKFENRHHPEFAERIKTYLNTISEYLPFVRDFHFEINSHNSFPHSSGIASSASSMSALALCLVSIEEQLFGRIKDDKAFFQKASFLSRLGSGSASRSVYKDYVVWGKHKNIPGSTDEVAIRLNEHISARFKGLRDAILITGSSKKKISSSNGHRLMNQHPYATARYRQAKTNMERLLMALKTDDEQLFIETTENEALSLHALMMTSAEGYTLLNENSWNIINRIRQYRKDKSLFLTFTLDAGPNVHVLYAEENKAQIHYLIEKELLPYCEERKWIDDQAGKGPQKIQ